MNSLPLWATALIFVGAAVAVWIAGIFLSNQTDVLATRLHLGSALGGVILLAIATNLPEIAITVSAAAGGNIGVAVGNILGGIAIQTVVLVVLDAFGRRGGPPLTYRAASLVLVIEGLLVVAVLMVVIAGTQLPAGLIAFRVAPGGVLIFVLWLAGLFLINRAHTALPWHESGQAPDGQPEPQGPQPAQDREEGHREEGLDREIGNHLRDRRLGHLDRRGVAGTQRRCDRRRHRPVRGVVRGHHSGRGDVATRAVHRSAVGPPGR